MLLLLMLTMLMMMLLLMLLLSRKRRRRRRRRGRRRRRRMESALKNQNPNQDIWGIMGGAHPIFELRGRIMGYKQHS